MDKWDIIIIGAGNGGLAAAATAANAGKTVLVLEKHNVPGGVATSFVRGRFEFEASLHELCGFGKNEGEGGTRKLFDELGISNRIAWADVPSAYRVISTSGGNPVDAAMPFGIEAYIEKMERYVPGSRPSMEKLFALAKDIVDTTAYMGTIEKYDFNVIKTILKEHLNFVRTAPYSVNDVLAALEVPKRAQDIFTAYWCYLGADCNNLGFVHYISMVYSYLSLGSVIPKGRSHDMSLALASVVEKNSGEIWYNSYVTKILSENGKISGVELADGKRVYSEHIICNCSPTAAYSKMLEPSLVPDSAVRRANARKFGARGFTVFLGLNRSAEELGITDHSLFIYGTSDSKEQFRRMCDLDGNDAQATVCLNLADKDCSPKGTCILYMTTLFFDDVWARVRPENYVKTKRDVAARMIASYEAKTGVKIREHIEEIEIAAPMTYARYTDAPQGTIYGYLAEDWDGIVPR
ncbi:MAG: NAD(P)/FAD-dependent oxidoreductase, partial [Clostridiales bacterium]|nr:NAD(P)/FAD-dependent oxidoreductase [Clostridiales bacterium]